MFSHARLFQTPKILLPKILVMVANVKMVRKIRYVAQGSV